MTAAISRQDEVLSRLLDLARSETPLPCLRVRASRAHLVKAFDVPGPSIGFLLQGRKRALQGGEWLSVDTGELFLVPGARSVDVENIPDPHSGEYLAMCIVLCENVLEAARQLLPAMPQVEPGPVAAVSLLPMLGALEDWCEALRHGDEALAAHAMLGVVLHLCRLGHQGLLNRPPPSLAAQIRSMVTQRPEREWSSGEIEEALAMSGATLRRHLAAEGTSLRELIANARLSYALQLLYSTRLPVKTVAQRVGYASVSSFSKRFTERYGMEPSRIGNA
ncbi:helix-turn-helix domain-containing protein [Uliginosibacterium aquaticum]|uniref:Helix-turn-helix transcriptional regulator n=1 Tax=Uliginosibacterium aquaticum TaxID=2731212 RepID=A0ABX2IDQ8_9RHOO|nr:helix-turn-helix transcriptional regulator [Uliginosibacterium aquaticum]NSL54704.1 helix-turn-helix transcriptional regulator [Uliginosibacterium aquaticum]